MNGPDPPYWTINTCFRVSRSVWVHLGMFHYYTKLGAKRVELVQLMHKFVPWSRFGIFRNERTQSTPLDSKLVVFWCIWQYFWLHETRCKTGWTGAIKAQACAMKSHRNFPQWTDPIHHIGPSTHVFMRPVVFGCIWECFITTRNSVQNGLNWCN